LLPGAGKNSNFDRTKVQLTFSLLIFVMAVVFPRVASADYAVAHADLVCDEASNVALARFAVAYNEGLPIFAALPEALDHGLSAQTGTGRRTCRLANGWEVKVRNGTGQAYAHGEGGGAPGSFFSLWVDRRKLISRQIWTDHHYAESKPGIVAVVITPSALTTCHGKQNDMLDGYQAEATCTDEPLDLTGTPIDMVEYGPGEEQPDGTITITLGPDEALCKSLLHRGPTEEGYMGWLRAEVEPDRPVADADRYWVGEPPGPARGDDRWVRISDPSGTFGVPNRGHVAFTPGGMDFDADGERDTVVVRGDESHYFDGSFWIVAPRSVAVADVLRRLYPSPEGADEEEAIKIAEREGWFVYSGGRPGLYPEVSPRYVHLTPIEFENTRYLFAFPTNRSHDPTAIVIRPGPAGQSRTVCVFQGKRLNY
jgi:hypothetical protein